MWCILEWRILKDYSWVRMKGSIRVMHCIIDDVYKTEGERRTKNKRTANLQNTKDPEMVALAIPGGKRICAS